MTYFAASTDSQHHLSPTHTYTLPSHSGRLGARRRGQGAAVCRPLLHAADRDDGAARAARGHAAGAAEDGGRGRRGEYAYETGMDHEWIRFVFHLFSRPACLLYSRTLAPVITIVVNVSLTFLTP